MEFRCTIKKVFCRTVFTLSITIYPMMVAATTDPDKFLDMPLESLMEVMITAQKREQSLQEVPVSVAVFGEDQLDRLKAGDFTDFADSVPGITYATTGLGNSRFFIRGIGQISAGQSPTTGIYLDETPLQIRTTRGASQPDPQLFDVQRIEVLRGPQGSLFGSSAMGGTVRVLANQPDASAFAATTDTSISNVKDGELGWIVSGMANVPLRKDTVALRVAAKVEEQAGWIDDLRPVTTDVFENRDNQGQIKEDINGASHSMIRAAIKFTPDDTWAITPSLLYQHAESDADRQFEDITFGLGAHLRARYQPTYSGDETFIANLTITKDLDLWGGINLLSSSSYMDRTWEMRFDASVFSIPDLGLGSAGEVPWSAIDDTVTTEQFSQEFRFSSTSDAKLQTIGGLYFKTAEQLDARNYLITRSFGVAIPFPTVPGEAPKFEEREFNFEEDEFAIFGEISYWLTEHIQLSLGGRFYHYDQTEHQFRYGPGGSAAGPLSFDFTESTSESGFIPRTVLSYQPSNHLNLYASYSKGFRTGGINAPIGTDVCTDAELIALGISRTPPAFDSDETENFELGLKLRALKNRVELNVSAYTINWNDFQQNAQLTCGPNPLSFTENTGEVSSDGAEVETSMQITDRLQVSAGVSYTDAVFNDGFTTLGLPPGSPLLDVPELTWNFRGEYTFPIANNWKGYLWASANFVDETTSGNAEGEPEVRPDYTLVNVRAGMEKNDLEISLFVDNLTDEVLVYGVEFASFPGVTTATSFFSAHVGAPRTVGLNLRKYFN